MDHINNYVEALERLRPFSREQLQALWPMWDKEDTLYVHASNAIEGNTLTLGETSVVVQYGVTIGGKTVKEHLEAINGVKAYHLMLGMAQNRRPITRNTILALHEALLSGEPHAGAFRDQPVYIRGARYVPPDYERIGELIDKAFDIYRVDVKAKNAIISGAKLAFNLVTIHPFVDGNGRLSRLVNNLHLIQHGYPPVLIEPGADKARYFDSLAKGQYGEDPFSCDPAPFVGYMIEKEYEAFDRYLKALDISHGVKHEDVSSTENVDHKGVTHPKLHGI